MDITTFTGLFTFQVHLWRNGNITFVYKQVPVPVTNISDAQHPCKLGISDAYLFNHKVSTLSQAVPQNKRVIHERIDGRAWEDLRSVQVTFDPRTNLSAVHLGSTKVICSLEAEITAPRKKPGSGSISFSLDFLPMAHPSAVDASASSDSEVEQCLSMLESLYRDTYCIDFETLCIEIDKYVFDIRCTIKVLDYDGGLFDACTLAVSTALMGFKRNDVTYNAVTKKLKSHSAYDKALVPLTLYYKPATVTFGFISGIDEPMVDPTLEESSLIEGSLTIGANHRDEICLMHQCGNLRINSTRIQKCCELTLRYARELSKEMNKACTKPTQRN
ncbi:hypothetical protein niasHS_004783 [Heterodera schachtii]|uniref:Ribosomal RNA-processing protein 43 n=1 Tax=Heterodera schachtii TaxID=97005 RepID=A0ABD2JY65_HETSC